MKLSLLHIIPLWAFLYSIVRMFKTAHMLQLNGYFNVRYFRWIGNNKSKVFRLRDLLPILALPLFFIESALPLVILVSFIYLALIMVDKGEKAKKPLVTTKRVKRLFVTITLVSLALILLAVFLIKDKSYFSFGMLVFSCLVPFFIYWITAIANAINKPIEHSISQGFVNRARKKIQGRNDLKIIGITGSYGKTSTKSILKQILSYEFNTLMTPGSYNTTLGVTRVINEMLSPLHEVFIAEMGARLPGDIKEITELVQPQYGILTAIGEQHLETFKHIDNIKKTKYELIAGLPETGIAVFNYDNEYTRQCALETKKKTFTYSVNDSAADFYSSDLKITSKGMAFRIHHQSESVEVETRLLGDHNISNILAAVVLATDLGVKFNRLPGIIRKLAPFEHRLELKKVPGGITILDDAFNSNPVGSKAALKVLKLIEGGKKILITPGMIELADKEYDYNYQFGEYASEACDYIILVGQKQTIPIQKALEDKGFNSDKIYIANTFTEGYQHMMSFAKPEDVVLFENDLPDTYNE